MSDIVERLRTADISGHGSYSALVREAADEIERLKWTLHQAEVTRVINLEANRKLAEEIERLRSEADGMDQHITDQRKEIERLREQLKMADELQQQWAVGIERLKAALREIAEHRIDSVLASQEKRGMARAALEGKS